MFKQGEISQDELTQGAVTGISQVLNSSPQGISRGDVQRRIPVAKVADRIDTVEVVEYAKSGSDSEDSEYVPRSDDSGEDDETMQLRKFANMYKKRLRDSQRFVHSEATGAVPVDLMANVEEVIKQQNIEAEYDS
jgi:hypothetical protein